ncbi:hypothetical protein COCSUDRAFT_33242 [Coccomyxa subellipsoidea C-169]|uniref:Uncharacterized protein n=2 Tax=Coccomyxa subellipsoidea (strain C-169) TaxID=574566 RepID=I0YP63_COCSC|nr:hypothetical protein COCSUDRAFT_34061 [Coccomyxa subellipsoidea C-169]XP_005645247.1 hypothetical protein COCSUDRAFT_33860 [Coccomyxa subellipsoidea C-169]XP_005647645.1 hypothetical protein COCSUDRAFT_33242 [Coccomyxa subellipsoidea C-169]EIE20182.1 hypothetical protein COCSUDRAFT_34061 [Coccomyxa subellipsoidea C-169]EIE20703.1 hypothetical protein COCSUDRAFT_33860 [Coccomyxa subellipsoidea C-169]EIE23101.1 hypothetical protein COCSUDRAFT_33242 [Coccomyxa subellipsoidea C-169]|eukprot:XP_005644726.1 hypothetical protein COCSUDRAFT_34061 [Coccomyxa subellipsoidea C-169]
MAAGGCCLFRPNQSLAVLDIFTTASLTSIYYYASQPLSPGLCLLHFCIPTLLLSGPPLLKRRFVPGDYFV